MKAVVFDLGQVVVAWDPLLAVNHLFADEAEARAEPARIDFGAFNAEQDRGRSWEDGIASAPDDAARQVFAAYRDNIDLAHAVPVEGTSEVIEALHANGVALYGLTNASVAAFESIARQHPCLARLGEVVVSAEEGLNKPDPELFARLFARVGRSPSDLLFVDDKPDNIAAAQALGMAGHLFKGAPGLRQRLRGEGLL